MKQQKSKGCALAWCGGPCCPDQTTDGNVAVVDSYAATGDRVLPVTGNNTQGTWDFGKDEALAQFTIFLDKNSDKNMGLGLDVDVDGAALLVDDVREGLVRRWNESGAGPEVRKGDRIVEVNSAKGEARQLIDSLNNDEVLRVMLRRPEEFSLDLRKTDDCKHLGLELSYCAGGATLLVQGVSGGLVSTWNEANPDVQLLKGDRITEVNGLHGKSQELFAALTTSERLEISCIKALAPVW